MILYKDAFWNLVTGSVLLVVLVYAYWLHNAFKGGAIRRAYTYMLVALGVMCFSFLGKVPLDIAGITDPLAPYGVAYTNFGVLLGSIFLVLSVRELAKLWATPVGSPAR
ncbi:MAG: hypothetical protein JRM73_04570 [Nitrososphaerota archaeon]|nr:hypothetical protein [Nitrososphaerota archaeon]